MTMSKLTACKSAHSLRCCSASHNSARSNIKLSTQIVQEYLLLHAAGRSLMTLTSLDQRLGPSSHRSSTSYAAIKSP
jgi:hypothetical protein